MKKTISKELQKDLKEFISYLGGNLLDGVTYVVLQSKTHKAEINKFNALYEKVRKYGYQETELFRRESVGTGYIYDIDLSVATHLGKSILLELSDDLGLSHNKSRIETRFSVLKQIRELELKRLVSLIDECKKEVDIVLFASDLGHKVEIVGKNKRDYYLVSYYAFRLSQWDLADLNKHLQVQEVQNIEINEILPNNKGLRVKLKLRK